PGTSIIGNWQGTGRGKDRNIQFTQDGRFVESGPDSWNQPRSYRVVDATLELDVSPAEKDKLEKQYAKLKIKVDVPDKWKYNVKLTDGTLTLSPQAMRGVLAQDYPGTGAFGLMKAQKYQSGGIVKDPPKDPPPDSGDLAKLVVGTWEGTSPATFGRKVEFTANRFIQHTDGGKSR